MMYGIYIERKSVKEKLISTCGAVIRNTIRHEQVNK